MSAAERRRAWHRFHAVALWSPYVLFVTLYFLPWNPIYPAILCLAIGGIASGICRPDLNAKGLVGGAVFLFLYATFMLGLVWFTPGYIPHVWNLPALSGVLVGGILDDLRHAEEIALAHFRQRPWTQRLAERVANLFTRLL